MEACYMVSTAYILRPCIQVRARALIQRTK